MSEHLNPHSSIAQQFTTRYFLTLTPEIAFQTCANAAAAQYRQAPPFVTYRVATHVSAPSLRQSRDVLRSVSVRTSDDTAVIQDLPKGRSQVAHGFPVTPAFDALSYFVFSWRVSGHQDVAAYVHDVKPLQYDMANASRADVVVISLRAYKPEYAPDSSEAPGGRTHLKLTPYQFVRDQSNPDTTFFFSDVFIDNATGLPTSVKFEGPSKEFVVDYAMLEGHWMVNHIHYEETLRGPLSIGRLRVVGDSNYDQFAFPTTPPDPRLQ